MGLVTSGIPQAIVRQLARLAQASVFVETGTFQGATARWAAGIFDEVHTIELSRELYEASRSSLSELSGVRPHYGNSASILPEIVSGLSEQAAVFWLDGHWSGGETAGEEAECPLVDELHCLADRSQDVILIDDARLFLSAPQPPHRPEQWPTIAEIVRILDQSRADRFIQVIDDVIYAVPNEPAVKNALVHYAQERTVETAKSGGLRLRRMASKLLRA